MGSAFHQLCPRYSGTLTPTAPMAIRLWETFTYLEVGENLIFLDVNISLDKELPAKIMFN